MNKAKTTTVVTTKSNKSVDKVKAKENPSKRNQSEEKVANKPKSKSKKEEKENKPKRNMNAYMFFGMEERKKVTADGFSGKEVLAEVGKRWEKLAEKEKKRYNDMADKDKERYLKEMKDGGFDDVASKPKRSTTANKEKENKEGRKSTGKRNTEQANKGKKNDEKDKKRKSASKSKKPAHDSEEESD